MTPQEAGTIIALIAARYPTPMLPEETLDFWAHLIEDLDYEQACAQAWYWFRSQPADERLEPAVLRRLVAAAQAAALAQPHLEPEEAWAFVTRAFTVTGRYRPFPRTHPLVADVVDALGWETLCNSDNPVADRAHFLQLYRARLERGRRAAAAAPGARPPQLPPSDGALPLADPRLPALMALAGRRTGGDQ
jgi:hypothetical protein